MEIYAVIVTEFLGMDSHTYFKNKSNALNYIKELREQYSKDKDVEVIEFDDPRVSTTEKDGFYFQRYNRQLYDIVKLEKIETQD